MQARRRAAPSSVLPLTEDDVVSADRRAKPSNSLRRNPLTPPGNNANGNGATAATEATTKKNHSIFSCIKGSSCSPRLLIMITMAMGSLLLFISRSMWRHHRHHLHRRVISGFGGKRFHHRLSQQQEDVNAASEAVAAVANQYADSAMNQPNEKNKADDADDGDDGKSRAVGELVDDVNPDDDDDKDAVAQEGGGDGGLPRFLEDFETLEEAIEGSHLTGIYFAAAWCPQCTKVSLKLDESINLITKLPHLDNAPGFGKVPFALVHVSSDRSDAERLDYLNTNNRKDHWIDVPWDHPERTWLKQYFKACSKPEMEVLNLPDRLHEVPTLVVLDPSRTPPQVLTFNGAQDVLEKGLAESIEKWMELRKLSQAMDARMAEAGLGADQDDQET